MGEPRRARQAPLVLAIAGASALALSWPHLQLPQLLGAAALLAAASAVPFARRPLASRWRPATHQAPAGGRIELFSRKAVVAAGNRMLKAGRGDERPLTLAVVELSDLPEVHSLFGRDAAGQITRRMAVRLQAIATDRGLAERTGATQFTVLLPGMEAATARRALRAVFGEAGCIEYECDGNELLLLPEFHVAQVPEHHASILETYASACAGVAKARAPVTRQPASARAYVPTVPIPL